MSDYPNSQILVDVAWLNHHLVDHPQVRILDVRASDPRLPIGYRMGHIPHAMAFDPSQIFWTRTMNGRDLAPLAEIANELGKRGISNDSNVVIYDEWTGQLAAMAFWGFTLVGHQKIKILHGGWAAWQNAGGVVDQNTPSIAPTQYRIAQNANARATADWIRENSSRSEVLLLDTRSDGEYRMGHIPGAVNLPWDNMLDPRTQNFKDAATLRAQLESVGATPDKEIIAYCRTGARSSHMFTTLTLMGYPRIRNYDGSMVDWDQAHGLPVE
jgi:thiosulfate/3-mercaptopyruvate sulfurtransferase